MPRQMNLTIGQRHLFPALLTLLLVLFAGQAWGAAYNSSQTGNWSESATWGGAGVPGNGDTVTLDHAVTVDANATIGTSPSDQTTMVVTINTDGRLILAQDVQLLVRGNVYMHAGSSGNPVNAIQLNPGSRFTFDSSQATTTTQIYRITHGEYSIIYARGTSANPAYIESLDEYGRWNITYRYFSNDTKTWDVEHTHIRRLGDSASSSTSFVIKDTTGQSKTMRFVNSVFDECSRLTISGNHSESVVVFTGNTLKNSITTLTNGIQINGNQNLTTGSITVSNNVFHSDVLFYPASNIVAENNYFTRVETSNPEVQDVPLALFKDNFVTGLSGVHNFYGDVTDSYLVFNGGSNPGGPKYVTGTYPVAVSGSIFDSTNKDDPGNGDLIFHKSFSGEALTLTKNILLPNGSNASNGKFLSVLYGDNSYNIVVENNTFVTVGVNESGIGVGEWDEGHVNAITSLKNNLVWTPDGKTAGAMMIRQQSNKQDYVNATNVSNNWGWNLTSADEAYGFYRWTDYRDTSLFSDGYPANAFAGTGDPQFVDPTRNVMTYDTAGLGNTATAWADTTAYVVGDIVSASDAGYYNGATINYRCILAHTAASGDSTNGKPGVATEWRTNWEPASFYRLREDVTLIPSLVAWVKAGFTPQNSSLDGAGYDGSDIGAMSFDATAAPTITTTSPEPFATVGVEYIYDFNATGSPDPTWALDAGSGTINATSGVYTWTPSAEGNNTVTVRASNSEGNATHTWTIEATETPPVQYYIGLSVEDNFTWSPTPDELDRVYVNQGEDITITATPASGYEITDMLADAVSVGAVDSHTFTNVSANHTLTAMASMIAPTITSSPRETAYVDRTYSYQAQADGYTPVWSKVSGPPEANINTSTGFVTWIPTETGEYTLTIRATNNAGSQDQVINLLVTERPNKKGFGLFRWTKEKWTSPKQIH